MRYTQGHPVVISKLYKTAIIYRVPIKEIFVSQRLRVLPYHHVKRNRANKQHFSFSCTGKFLVFLIFFDWLKKQYYFEVKKKSQKIISGVQIIVIIFSNNSSFKHILVGSDLSSFQFSNWNTIRWHLNVCCKTMISCE